MHLLPQSLIVKHINKIILYFCIWLLNIYYVIWSCSPMSQFKIDSYKISMAGPLELNDILASSLYTNYYYNGTNILFSFWQAHSQDLILNGPVFNANPYQFIFSTNIDKY